MCSIMLITLIFLIPVSAIELNSKMEANIVGGEVTSIENFPHSAFLEVTCKTQTSVSHWICGSSIINQDILLTAAHCLDGCLSSSHISVFVGSSYKKKGLHSSVSKFLLHEHYDPETIKCDIALVMVHKTMTLGKKVRRVVLMNTPPYQELARVAGWGLIDEHRIIGTNKLKQTEQNVYSRHKCISILHAMPRGCICAGFTDENSYAARGDSGSALVVRGYIQIGIVSYKLPSVSVHVVVYTDVGYYYNWIKINTKKIYCV